MTVVLTLFSILFHYCVSFIATFYEFKIFLSRNAFDEDRIPDLYGDDSILQDIHCVSSVLKMYFRELPNPLLTYQLYEKFVAAVMQDEDIRLLYLRDVVQQLPPPHYR